VKTPISICYKWTSRPQKHLNSQRRLLESTCTSMEYIIQGLKLVEIIIKVEANTSRFKSKCSGLWHCVVRWDDITTPIRPERAVPSPVLLAVALKMAVFQSHFYWPRCDSTPSYNFCPISAATSKPHLLHPER